MKLETEKTLSWIGAGSPTTAMIDRVLGAFDLLEPGQHLTVASDGPLAPLLSALRQARPALFEWTPLPPDRELRSVEISRRAAAPGALREINEALSWDHDRLDALDAAVFELRHEQRFEEAAALFAVFAFGLRRHIRFEEEILFPEFDAKSGFPAPMGPTAVMRDEHRGILECLDGLGKAVGDPGARAESLRHALHDILVNHNLKEEHVVYPGTDRALTATERDALVARIQAMA